MVKPRKVLEQEAPIVYRTAEEIAYVIGVAPTCIKDLVDTQGLPAWRRTDHGIWYALRDDLVGWLHGQRDKYLKPSE